MRSGECQVDLKRLVKFAKECKDKKLRAFSSYKTKKDLSDVLAKYGVDDNVWKISRCLNFKPTKFRKATNIISIAWQRFWPG